MIPTPKFIYSLCFLKTGVKILFRVGLVLLKYGLRDKIIKKCPSMYEVLQELRNIDQRIMSEGFLLIQVSFGFFLFVLHNLK